MINKMKFLCVLLMCSTQAFPCSTLSIEDGGGKPWVMKSFDYGSGKGFVFINKKNIAKKSLTFSMGLGKKWTSQYGSVTFNQIARDFPYGGMNERGLNMEIMWLDEAKYPTDVKRVDQINESQLIQYVLDTSATTEEALEKIKEVAIVPIMATVHYMICDEASACSTVEYLDGKLVVHEMNKGKERILQNSIYSDMLNYSIRESGRTVRNNQYDMDFIFNNNANATSENAFVQKAFKNLDKVKQYNWTRWQIVYNLADRKVWFRTMAELNMKSLSLNDYELDCKVDEKESGIDIDSPIIGDIHDDLIPFTKEINSDLLGAFKGVPSWMREIGNTYSMNNHKCIK